MVKLLVSKEASHCVGVLDRRSIWAYAFVLLTGTVTTPAIPMVDRHFYRVEIYSRILNHVSNYYI